MLIDDIKDRFRARALKKWKSKVPTSLRSLDQVRSVAVLMDVEDPGFREYQERIGSWVKAMGIKPDLHFFDFRRLEKGELLITSIQNTVLKKDLNWFDMPDPVHVVDINADLFISMVDNADYPVRFYMTCSRARFKVGRVGWEGHPFDLLVSGAGSSADEVFSEMKKYLEKL